jgi:hypothetical protein
MEMEGMVLVSEDDEIHAPFPYNRVMDVKDVFITLTGPASKMLSRELLSNEDEANVESFMTKEDPDMAEKTPVVTDWDVSMFAKWISSNAADAEKVVVRMSGVERVNAESQLSLVIVSSPFAAIRKVKLSVSVVV